MQDELDSGLRLEDGMSDAVGALVMLLAIAAIVIQIAFQLIVLE